MSGLRFVIEPAWVADPNEAIHEEHLESENEFIMET